MNKNAKKWIFNALFLALVFGATIYGLFNGQDFSELSKNLEKADFRWMIPAIFCVVMFICLESLIIYYLVHSLRCRARLPHCFLYSFAGFFFSCITPMAGGGQPAQIYLMNRDDIPVSVATPVLMVVTITYKLVLILVGAAFSSRRGGRIYRTRAAMVLARLCACVQLYGAAARARILPNACGAAAAVVHETLCAPFLPGEGKAMGGAAWRLRNAVQGCFGLLQNAYAGYIDRTARNVCAALCTVWRNVFFLPRAWSAGGWLYKAGGASGDDLGSGGYAAAAGRDGHNRVAVSEDVFPHMGRCGAAGAHCEPRDKLLHTAHHLRRVHGAGILHYCKKEERVKSGRSRT